MKYQLKFLLYWTHLSKQRIWEADNLQLICTSVESLLLYTLLDPNLFHTIAENLFFLPSDQQILKADHFGE